MRSDTGTSRRLRSLYYLVVSVAAFYTVTMSNFAMASPAEVVARTGMTTPYGANVTYQRFLASGFDLGRPLISKYGQQVFWSTLGGSGAPSGTTLALIRRDGESQISAWRQATQPPGASSGTLFAGLYALKMNSTGDVTFVGSLTGPGVQPGVNDRGVWLVNDSGSSLLVRDGTAFDLAGYPGASMDWLVDSQLADSGAGGPSVLIGNVAGTGLGTAVRAVLRQSGPGFFPAMLANLQLQDAGPGTNIFNMTPLVSPSGIAAYQTTLIGPGVGTVNISGVPIITDKALVVGEGAQQRTIARSGFQIPSEPQGVVFWQIWGGSARMSTNQSGDLAFSASMFGPGIYTSNNWGIWVSRAGQLSRLVRLTDPSPVAGTTIGSFAAPGGSFIVLADSGAVVYTAMLLGGGANTTNNGTIIHAQDGAHTLVARAGVDLPGLPSGVRIKNNNLGLGARISSQGHVALAAELEGTGVVSTNNAAMFLWTPGDSQGLRKILREGEVIGQYRITTIAPTGTDLQVNSFGEIAFTATVVDVNDALLVPRIAIIAASPTTPAQIVAVEGGVVQTQQGALSLSTVRMGTTQALSEAGEIIFAAAINSATPNDEAVIKVQLAGAPECPADFDRSGVVNTADIFTFLSAWFAQSMTADFDGSGTVAVPDIFAFLSVWFEGC